VSSLRDFLAPSPEYVRWCHVAQGLVVVPVVVVADEGGDSRLEVGGPGLRPASASGGSAPATRSSERGKGLPGCT